MNIEIGDNSDFEALLAFLLDRFGRKKAKSIDARIKCARRVMQTLEMASDPVVRALAIGHIARQLDLPSP